MLPSKRFCLPELSSPLVTAYVRLLRLALSARLLLALRSDGSLAHRDRVRFLLHRHANVELGALRQRGQHAFQRANTA